MTDHKLADTIYIMFTTRAFATGIPTALAGTPVVSAYEDDSVTQITAGITLGVSHDSVVGLNLLTIVATGANGYETGKDYNLVITTGTVGGVSVVGEVVGRFTLDRSAAAQDLANATDGLGAIKAETAAILVDTAVIGAAGAGLTALATQASVDVIDGIVDAILVDTGTTLPATLATIDGIVDAILVDTGTTLPATLTTILGHIDTEVAAILVDTGTTIPALIAALNDLSAAQVNAEVVDALATDTYAEPTGVPGATVTLAAKIGFLYMALRNQVTITATKKTFFDDGGLGEWEKDLSDDGTTYTETEANVI